MDNHPVDLPPPGGSRTPRKELQGPKPPPLKVRKDSFKIKKPPVAPPTNHQQPPQQPPRKPVIIYTVSPKVIHANPSEFMTVVQRLTGPDPTPSTPTASSSSSSFQFPPPSFSSMADHRALTGELISPAARFASIEKMKTNREGRNSTGPSEVTEGEMVEISGGGAVERTGFFPAGILSPGPGSLPPVSPNLFSPLFHDPDIAQLNLFQHESIGAIQHQPSNRNLIEQTNISNNLPSPFSINNFISPSPITNFSPSSIELLRRIFDN